LKIGVNLSVTDRLDDFAAVAKQAEDLGFESIWISEHTFVPVKTDSRYAGTADGSIPESMAHIADPFVCLAMAAAATKTIKLGTAVCLIPQRHPLLLANEIATLDHFSGGRFMLGAGTGWLKEESEILGGDFDHRWTQAAESIRVMKEVWTNDEAEYHGRYYDFPPIRSFPKPAQKPHPPIYLGGSAANVFKRIVSYADGWLPTGRVSPDQMKEGCRKLQEVCAEMGRDYESIDISAYAQPPDPDLLRRYEEAGASRATIRVADYPGSPNLPSLEEAAERVL
jgi:probable F420-dependent oxidoreductase